MSIMKDSRGEFYLFEETYPEEQTFADTDDFHRVDDHNENTIKELRLGVE